ncbi:unnamed protein product, partial [Brassica oleracea var. botrytis]
EKPPSFSQAKEKKKNTASQDSDPPPSSSGVAPFISSISILGFGETIFGDFRFIGSSLQLQQIFSYLLLMVFTGSHFWVFL